MGGRFANRMSLRGGEGAVALDFAGGGLRRVAWKKAREARDSPGSRWRQTWTRGRARPPQFARTTHRVHMASIPKAARRPARGLATSVGSRDEVRGDSARRGDCGRPGPRCALPSAHLRAAKTRVRFFRAPRTGPARRASLQKLAGSLPRLGTPPWPAPPLRPPRSAPLLLSVLSQRTPDKTNGGSLRVDLNQLKVCGLFGAGAVAPWPADSAPERAGPPGEVGPRPASPLLPAFPLPPP